MTTVARYRWLGLLAVIVFAAAAWTAAPAQIAPGPSKVLDDPAIREIIAMTEAGIGPQVIIERIRQIPRIPQLDGDALAELKKMGVADLVLFELVKRSEEDAPLREEPEEPVYDEGMPGGVRVAVQSQFSLSWVRVTVDGREVAELGRIATGQSERGMFLERPPKLKFKDGKTVFDGVIEPGVHKVRVDYAVTWIEDEYPEDIIHEYTRQRYHSSGVGEHSGREDPWNDGNFVPGSDATCTVGSGRACVVTATTHKHAPTRAGGLSVYSVEYEVAQE